MKKIGRLILILALALILLPCAASGESKEEFKAAMDDALRSMEEAFSSGVESAAVAATSAAVNTGYGRINYLHEIHEDDDRIMGLLRLIVYAHAGWRDSGDYASYLEQAYALNEEILRGGGEESHGMSLSIDSAVLSGPGYTAIPVNVYSDCEYNDADAFAGSVKRNGHVIPVKVYRWYNPDRYDGDGNEVALLYSGEGIGAYIDEADYEAAPPGTYTGSLPYRLIGSGGPDGRGYSFRYEGEIRLTLVKPGTPVECIITAEESPEESGTVGGAEVYSPDVPVLLTAEAAEHYRFVNWTENGSVVSTDANYTFTATADRHLVANFEEYAPELTSVTVTPPTRTQYNIGEALNTAGMAVTAHYADETEKVVTSSAVLSGFDSSAAGTVNVTASYTEGGKTESAMFQVVIIEPVGRDITIDVVAEPDYGGTASGGGTYPMNTFVTLTATPNEGYIFAGWIWNN